MPECETYGDGRVACAVKVDSPSGKVTTIAGLHHAGDDLAFTLPSCEGFALDTTAEEVYNDPTDANLEAYVKGVIKVAQQQMKAATDAQLAEFILGGGNPFVDLIDPTSLAAREFGMGIFQRIYDKITCFRSGDLRHENIYAFVMSANPAVSTVLFNGNNFDLNGTNLELEDDTLSGEKNIARLFNNKLGASANGDSAYANYHWDDPTTTDDDVPELF